MTLTTQEKTLIGGGLVLGGLGYYYYMKTRAKSSPVITTQRATTVHTQLRTTVHTQRATVPHTSTHTQRATVFHTAVHTQRSTSTVTKIQPIDIPNLIVYPNATQITPGQSFSITLKANIYTSTAKLQGATLVLKNPAGQTIASGPLSSGSVSKTLSVSQSGTFTFNGYLVLNGQVLNKASTSITVQSATHGTDNCAISIVASGGNILQYFHAMYLQGDQVGCPVSLWKIYTHGSTNGIQVLFIGVTTEQQAVSYMQGQNWPAYKAVNLLNQPYYVSSSLRPTTVRS